MWLILCIASTIIAGLISIFTKKCTNKNENMKGINILSILIYHVFFLCVILISEPKIFLQFNFADLVKILPLAITQTVGAVSYYMSIKNSLVSTTAPITRAKAVVPLILGLVIINENLSIMQILLSVGLIALTILVSKSNKVETSSSKKGIIYAYGFVLFSGVSNFLNKVYINIYHDPLVIAFYFAITIIFSVLIYTIFTGQFSLLDVRRINAKRFFFMFVFLDFLSSLLIRFSLIDGPVSIVYVIESSAIIVTILASRLILKEKIPWRKALLITGIIICVVGLAISSYL